MYDHWEVPYLVSTLSLCYINMLFRQLNLTVSLIKELLATQFACKTKRRSGPERAHAIALDCHRVKEWRCLMKS